MVPVVVVVPIGRAITTVAAIVAPSTRAICPPATSRSVINPTAIKTASTISATGAIVGSTTAAIPPSGPIVTGAVIDRAIGNIIVVDIDIIIGISANNIIIIIVVARTDASTILARTVHPGPNPAAILARTIANPTIARPIDSGTNSCANSRAIIDTPAIGARPIDIAGLARCTNSSGPIDTPTIGARSIGAPTYIRPKPGRRLDVSTDQIVI